MTSAHDAADGGPGATSRQREALRVVILTTSGGGGAYGFLQRLLDALGHEIVGVLTTPGPPSIRSTDYLDVVASAGPDIDVIVSTNRDRWGAMLAPLRPDLIVCAAFPYRIPDDVLALPRLGAINGHSSLLPRYRGPNPQGWVFRNDEPETGMTVHRLTPEFDAGPVLAQVRIPVEDDDDIGSLGERLAPLLTEVFTTAIERAARGETGESQDPAAASGAPFFEPSWQRVDWTHRARDIHNQVRSLFELPGQPAGAVAEVDGREIRILRTQLVGTSGRGAVTSRDPAPQPGSVVLQAGSAPDDAVPTGAGAGIGNDLLTVQCGDVPLRIVTWTDI